MPLILMPAMIDDVEFNDFLHFLVQYGTSTSIYALVLLHQYILLFFTIHKHYRAGLKDIMSQSLEMTQWLM